MAANELLPERDDLSVPAEESTGLTPAEQRMLEALQAARGRVVTRTELARVAGLRHHPRRVDAHLVAVRRAVAPGAIRNVRSRGWMLVETSGTTPESVDSTGTEG